MAVTCTFVRNRQTENTRGTEEFITATLSGTYATGGFQSNLLAVAGGPGTSPLAGTLITDIDWRSPSGYIYRSSTAYAGRTATTTTKIFSAPGTELANGTAVPDPTCPVVVKKTKL